MNLRLELVGARVNTWPILTIKQGDKRYDFTVEGETVVDITLDDATFSLGMYNKSFGQNHVWDTSIDKQGNVLQDKFIQINSFLIDEVEINDLFMWMTYSSIEQGDQVLHDGVIRFNGCWHFDIQDGIPYNWIIDIRTPAPTDKKAVNYFSDYTVRDKDEQYKMMDKIRKLINI